MITIRSVEVRGFRNLAAQSIELHPRFNVLFGDNGQGKTSTLEAVYLATTSRSFRTVTLGECIAHDQRIAKVRVFVTDPREPGAPAREQRVDIDGTIGRGRRSVKLHGKRPATLAEFALATPIVLFEPATLGLSQGGATERRKLLDRVAVHLAAARGGAPALLRDYERYRRAHQHRKRALERGLDARAVEPFEQLMGEHGAAIVRARAEAAACLAPRTTVAFTRIAQTPLALDVAYAPRAPGDAAEFVRALAQSRADDARRGRTRVGPHLDELTLTLDGRPAREVASQGQHRALVLALKGAELATIADARGVQPILLLDDVSSELDPLRNDAFFALLREQMGQVLLTTTRPELLDSLPERADLAVHGGVVRRVR
ncbi:MAG: DNA replication/repair protein RecF [Polyangiales bacterium]